MLTYGYFTINMYKLVLMFGIFVEIPVNNQYRSFTKYYTISNKPIEMTFVLLGI